MRQNDIRLASHQLHPAAVSVGLTTALQTLAAEYQVRFAVSVQVSPLVAELDSPEHNHLPEVIRLAAYRCVAEALGNVATHAEASAVLIQVDIDGGQLLVRVRDDGRGFEPAQAAPGLGLRIIAARVAELGGAY